MSNFIVYDKSRTRIGMITNAESIQWLENYQSPGEVKIILLISDEALELLQDGYRIYNTDSDTVARICERVIDDEEDANTITIRAQMTSQLLDDRVVMSTLNITNAEIGMYRAYSENRASLPIEVGNSSGYTERTEMEITWNSALDAENKLAAAAGLGYKVIFDPQTAVETFKVYKGTDRTDPGSDNYVGAFSVDFGNLVGVQLTESTADYKNYAIVAGEGEGADRTVITVSVETATGEERREMYVDARDIQSTYSVATKTGEVDDDGNPKYTYEEKRYSTAEYTALLKTRGLEKLAEQVKTFDVICDVDQTNIVFGEDYFLGDKVPTAFLGLTGSATVSTANRVYEDDKQRIITTLSDFVKD